MKKIFILMGMATLVLGLASCDGTTDDATKTPPVFTKIVVEDEDPFDGTEYTTYFKEKDDEVTIEVHLLNPYTYTVTSIVINGYNYRFSKFESGSDFEKIIINMPVGTSLGDMRYTVEEIVYQDGDVSKTIEVTEDNVFDVYVFKENPVVALEAYNLDKDSLALDFLITDSDIVIAPYSLIVSLYSNNVLIESKPLNVGTQHIVFDGLYSDNIYEVKVTADYDLEDGNGLIDDALLYSGLYSTLSYLAPTARIEGLTKTANSVTFDLIYNDYDNVTEVDGLVVELYKDDVVVDSQSVTETTLDMTFDVLSTDADYTIKVISSYNLHNGEGIVVRDVLETADFTTLERVIPIPEITDLVISEDEVSFGIFIDDPNSVIDTSTLVANIIVDGVVVQTAEINNYEVSLEVFGLFSDFNFDLEIRSSFDLNDGLGVQEDQSIFYQSYTTTSTLLPELSVLAVNVEQGYITVDFHVTDTDLVIVGGMVTARLYEEGVLVATEEFSTFDAEVVFEYLAYYDYTYEIIFSADYNLRDGIGNVTDYILDNKFLTSLSVKAPDADILNVVASQEEITFDVVVMDSDSTLTASTAYAQLFKDGVLDSQILLSPGLNEDLAFSALNSNSLYSIKIVGNYDLNNNDGEILEALLAEVEVSTLAKNAPAAYITDSVVSSTTLEFDINVVDLDDTIVAGTLMGVIKNDLGTIVDSINLSVGLNNITFVGLLSETEYLFEVVSDYNLNVGNSDVSISLDDIVKTTFNKELPSGYIISQSVSQDTYVADITIVDDYSVILGSIYATLYLDGAPTLHQQEIFVGDNQDVTFAGLNSNNAYEIIVEVDYNLNAGDADVHGFLIDDKSFVTDEKVVPDVTLNNVDSTFSEITFDAFITDIDSVIDGVAQAVMYLDGVEQSRQDLALGANSITFNGLPANTTYTFKIITDYDADDGEGLQSNYVLATFESSTDEKFEPVVSIDSAVTSQTSLTFDVSGFDTYTVIDGVITAYLYKDGAVIDSQVVGLDLATYSFTGLLTNNEYEIIIKASWDLDDNVTTVVDGQLDSITLTTLPKVTPYILITDETITEDIVSFSFDYTDNDSVMVGSNLIANIYYDGTLMATSPILNKTVSFDISSLLSGYSFTIEITGDYDLGDGALVQTNEVIYTKEYVTELNEIPYVNSYSVNKIGFISADISIVDNDLTYEDNTMVAELYENGILLETINLNIGVNNITFAHMATKLDVYEIKVKGSYNLRDGNGIISDVYIYENTFVVFNNQLPIASIENELQSQDTITFDVITYDPDAVLEATTLKAILYKDGLPEGQTHDLIVGANLGLVFNSLDSNSDYVVYIMASYDLDIGNGVESSSLDIQLFTTLTKVVPTATLTNLDSTFHEISFDIDLTDVDSVIVGNAVAELFDGSTLVDTFNLSTGMNNVIFGTLDADKQYSIKVSTSYNLDDGNGQIDDHIFMEFNLATDAKDAPIVTVANVSVTHDSILFDSTLLDADSVLESVVTASLELDGVEVDSLTITEGTASYSFAGLFADQEYEIIITGSYDLDDTVTVVVDGVLKDFTQTTLAYELPFISSSNVDALEGSITFDIDYEDIDGLIDETSHIAQLWYDGAMIAQTPLLNKTVSFHLYDILADSDYTIIITADYDLSVQSGAVTAGEIFNEVFHTGVNYLPEFNFGSLVVNQDTVTLNYTLQDSSSVLINLDEVADAVIEFVIYDSTGAELDRQESILGIGIDVTFDATLSYDEMYEIRIETDYNLRDGSGNFLNTSIYELIIGSQYKKIPEATISNTIIGTTTYTFDVSVLDVDSTIDAATLYAVLSDDLGVEADRLILLSVGDNLAEQFTGLTSGNDYTLDIITHYDLANGDGDITTVPPLDTISFTTN